MDKFVQYTETDTCTGQPILFGQPGLVMDYYDGNTVTALWNYAQNYAMSDNSYDTNFGPSTPGRAQPDLRQTHGDGYAVRPGDRHSRSPTPSSVQLAEQQGRGHRSTVTSTRPSTTAPTPATPRPTRSA